MSAACSFWRMLALLIQRIICAGWGAQASWTVFVPTAGGTISPSWPQAVDQTHIAPTDGATTFDSPFSAIDGRLGLGISLLPACGQGRALLMAFQGLPYPVLQTGFALPSSPVIDGGFFCAGETTPCGLCAGFRPNRRRQAAI